MSGQAIEKEKEDGSGDPALHSRHKHEMTEAPHVAELAGQTFRLGHGEIIAPALAVRLGPASERYDENDPSIYTGIA